MTKSFRHGQVLKIIRNREVHTQEELARALKRVGIPATQVTLSRDIRELGLVKTNEGYRQLESDAGGPKFSDIANEFLHDIRVAQNQVVLKTSPGNANSLAVALDKEAWAEVVGTLAGDDTVLVIAPDHATAQTLRKRLLALISR